MAQYRIIIILPIIVLLTKYLISQLQIRFNENLNKAMPLAEGWMAKYIDKHDKLKYQILLKLQ